MPDYSKSKIYKIVCNITGETYYGSTVQSVAERVGKHRDTFKLWKNGKGGHTKSYDIIERGDYDYSLVENYPCDSKEQLHSRERYWIENFECVNKCIPGRTKKEYREDNKEKIAEQNKEYKEANKEKIAEQNKEYKEANKEKIAEQNKEYREVNKEKIAEQNKEYYEQNKERIAEQNKEYREQNKEKIEEKAKVKIVCCCGSEVRKDSMHRHLKTKKHLAWVESHQ